MISSESDSLWQNKHGLSAENSEQLRLKQPHDSSCEFDPVDHEEEQLRLQGRDPVGKLKMLEQLNYKLASGEDGDQESSRHNS